jgi:hypothetical protein
LYVTWDWPEIDHFVAAIAAMDDVEVVRVPQPQLSGTRIKTGVGYQIRNLEAALACVPEREALIVKLRPDFIIDEEFLRAKIADFDMLCARSNLADIFGVAMPASPFAAKLWIPWADANLPLHFEDAAFIGLKCDVARLANGATTQFLESGLLSERAYGWFAHAARYATIFAPDYPIFDRYVADFRYFPNIADHRQAMMPAALKETFFWRLLVANAWILATSFHIDCGAPGQLTFYANSTNRGADWSSLSALKIHPPYNAVAEWRAAQHPGSMLHCVGRIHARLVDDSWQHALFMRATLGDLTPDNLRGALRLVAQYRRGVVEPAEDALYRMLDHFYRARVERAVEAVSG